MPLQQRLPRRAETRNFATQTDECHLCLQSARLPERRSRKAIEGLRQRHKARRRHQEEQPRHHQNRQQKQKKTQDREQVLQKQHLQRSRLCVAVVMVAQLQAKLRAEIMKKLKLEDDLRVAREEAESLEMFLEREVLEDV